MFSSIQWVAGKFDPDSGVIWQELPNHQWQLFLKFDLYDTFRTLPTETLVNLLTALGMSNCSEVASAIDWLEMFGESLDRYTLIGDNLFVVVQSQDAQDHGNYTGHYQ